MTLTDFLEQPRDPEIELWRYIELLPKGARQFTEELVPAIAEASKEGNEDLLVCLMDIAARDGLGREFTKVYCNILDDDKWTWIHEEVVLGLNKIEDPESVECIYNRAIQIPSHDGTGALVLKCLWALNRINTPEAHAKIALLAAEDSPLLQIENEDFATERLRYARSIMKKY